MEIKKQKFKKKFPNLFEEIEKETKKIEVTRPRITYHSNRESFSRYEPNVIDFLRRCETENQAKELLSFLERTNNISLEYANLLRKRLEEGGVRVFGKKKGEDYYLKKEFYEE